MIEFSIPVKLKTHNELLRMHWAKRSKYYELLRTEVYCAVPFQCMNGRPRSKKTVKILYLTKRKQDPDNYIASLKGLIDSLVKLELLKDDSPDWMDLHAEQHTSKEAYKIIVEVL